MARPTLLVTDFAGTTLRDDGTVVSAYRRVLSVRDIPFSDADLAARRGASKRAVFEDFAARVERDPERDTVVGADDVPVGRPAPFLIYRAMMDLEVLDVASVAVVGDTTLDLRSAANARAGWGIGVLSGAHDLSTLGAEAHTHLLPSVTGLPALFGLHD